MKSEEVHKKKVIYCVEDDGALLAVYAMSFSSETYDVALFTSGTVCIECMKMVTPDLVFLDLNLPDLDGFGFLELASEVFPGKRVPVVIVSGLANAPAVKRAKDFNVYAYLVKPLTPDKLAAFADEFFITQADDTLAALIACLKYQEEICLLDFQKFAMLEPRDKMEGFFERVAKTGLVVDLGNLSIEYISEVDNYVLLQQVYKYSRGFNKVRITSDNEHVFRFLRNVGKFTKTDLYNNRNAAVRNIRIDVEFSLEE